MSRTITKVYCTNYKETEEKILEILKENEFEQILNDTEIVWMNWQIIGEKMLKYYFSGNYLTITAWVTLHAYGCEEHCIDDPTGARPLIEPFIEIVEQIKKATR